MFEVCQSFESGAVQPHGGVSHPGDWNSQTTTRGTGQQGLNNCCCIYCVQEGALKSECDVHVLTLVFSLHFCVYCCGYIEEMA